MADTLAPERVEAGERGRLVVSERAVSRIVEAAAAVPGTRRTSSANPRTAAAAVWMAKVADEHATFMSKP